MTRRSPIRRKTPLKKNATKTLKRKAWMAISRYVRNRDPFCVSCLVEGKKIPTAHCGHYQYNTERNQQLGGNALWYDLRNLNGQCAGCNLFKSGNLSSYAIYLTDHYGTSILQELRNLFNTPKKWSTIEVQALIDEYEGMVE
jgi:5-methylcytosine-specific restriction endonuclease McrA